MFNRAEQSPRPYGANKEYCKNVRRSQVFNRAEQSPCPYKAKQYSCKQPKIRNCLFRADNIRPYGANKEYCKVQPYKAKGSAYPRVQPQHTLYSQSIPKIRKCLTGRSRAHAPTEQIKNIVTIPNARKCLTGRSRAPPLQS